MKKGILLLNLGSPNSPKVRDVRVYLKEFLSDGRVLDAHPLIRWLVLNLFILPFRPKRSAEAYQKVWSPEGSPLVTMTYRQRDLLSQGLDDDIPIEVAMRYGRPSVSEVIHQLKGQGVEALYALPLYPHYAMSSYETVVVRVVEEVARQAPQMRVDFLQPFFDDATYIDALVQSASAHLDKEHDLLLFSFHGLPERHLRVSDPSNAHCTRVPDCCNNCNPAHATCYRHQCYKTVEKFREKAGIPKEKCAVSFQSRLGREPWLEPYTDVELVRFAKSGVKKLLVICPSFVTDCLETLEEITMEGRETFLEAGGETFEQIPCLNDHPAWIRFLREKVLSWQAGVGGATPTASNG